MNKLPLLNRKFGKLTVVKSINGGWECICECGNITNAKSCHLTQGRKKSCGCLVNLETGEASFNHLFGNYKDRAIRKNLEFKLNKEEFKELTKQNCYYCNIEPRQVLKKIKYKGNYIYNGIDRVDNNKGYILDNVIPCCGMCNKAKRHLTKEVFEKWIVSLINSYKAKIA